ncbi:MAG TPA: hypothetical protein VMB26_09900 [Candidatus Binataceae bacterium]|nr:hypothetical protein [Candidatus Binataceae bacterium]
MKACHAAALALMGWYLMTPPMDLHSNDVTRVDKNAPLSKWGVVESFDTEAACIRKIGRLKNDPKHEEYDLFIGAKCVSMDDPHLKEK